MRPGPFSICRAATGARRTALSAMFAGLLLATATVSAAADELVWRFKSEHQGVVSLEFYSQDRNKSWPGGGEVYVIDDWKTNRFPIDCEQGETICYGAWVRGEGSTYWGMGPDGREPCDNCCARCGGGTLPVQVLKP